MPTGAIVTQKYTRSNHFLLGKLSNGLLKNLYFYTYRLMQFRFLKRRLFVKLVAVKGKTGQSAENECQWCNHPFP